ncbi:MAG: peptide-binding protein [Leptospirales bacterium]|nr:peptide-binding protein [Leptospirales bacterium]
MPERAADVLYMQLAAEPDTLNPITATDAYSSTISGRIYETLLERNKDTLEMEPKLAESWKVSPNKLRYRFVLKKNIFWSDGVEFTADDVVYSFNTIKDPKVACMPLKGYYNDISECRKIDRYTVEFISAAFSDGKAVSPYFLALEFCGTMPIVPKHIFDDGTDFNTHKNNKEPVGTGPFKFLRWKTGTSIELIRNENYWDTKPAISRIVYRVIPESSVALQMLKKGDIDVMTVRPIQWERQTNSEKFNEKFYKFNYYKPHCSYIGWNSRRPFFSDSRVRRAMTMLIDRESILEKLLFGRGMTVSSTFYAFSPAYNKNIKPWPYDPQMAVSLLKEAGWADTDGDGILDKDGVKFSFTINIPSGTAFSERLSVMIKEDFSKVGIAVSINRFEWAVFLSKINARDFDAVILAWSLGYSNDPYQLWYSKEADLGSNFCGFSNEEADRIILAARQEFDENKRNCMYHRFHEILHNEQPYTFLFCNQEHVAVSKRFSNVKLYTMGLDINEWEIAQ